MTEAYIRGTLTHTTFGRSLQQIVRFWETCKLQKDSEKPSGNDTALIWIQTTLQNMAFTFRNVDKKASSLKYDRPAEADV